MSSIAIEPETEKDLMCISDADGRAIVDRIFADIFAGRRRWWDKPIFVQVVHELLGNSPYSNKQLAPPERRLGEQYAVFEHAWVPGAIGVVRYNRATQAMAMGLYLPEPIQHRQEYLRQSASHMLNSEPLFIGDRFRARAPIRVVKESATAQLLRQAYYVLEVQRASTIDLVCEPTR